MMRWCGNDDLRPFTIIIAYARLYEPGAGISVASVDGDLCSATAAVLQDLPLPGAVNNTQRVVVPASNLAWRARWRPHGHR